SVGITVLYMTGSQWLNYGTYLASYTPGFGYTPATIFVNTSIGGTPAAQTFYDLLVQGTMSVQNGLTVTRNVTIAPGGTLNGGASLTHAVGGNWTNNGTFNCGTSTVNFTGKFGRTISGTTFYNVILNDSLGATLTGDVTIAPGGSLVLSAGNIATGAATLTIDADNPGAFTPGPWKLTGTVVRAIAPGSTGTYMLFDAHSYVVPGGTGNPGTITAAVYPNTNPPGLPHAGDTSVVLKRYYAITGAGSGPGFTYTLCVSYNRSEVRGIEQLYTFWGNSGAGWVNAGSAGQPDTSGHYAVQTGLTGWSQWTLAESTAPLPIQLMSFQASAVSGSGDVKLSWTTASEINNYGFYVQRSGSLSTGFADVPGGFVAGNGTSVAVRQYSWVDRNPLPGTNYYRLRQVDLDGSSRLTEPLKVVQGAAGTESSRQPAVFALGQNYPNPFNPSTRMTFTLDNSAYTTLKVYNILGDEVGTLYEGMAQAGTEYNVSFDGTSLANGAYFYRLVSGQRTLLKKMVLVK
ncbi:MAG TPA: T9SS type A sorting domain-containing protein, partial [Bacteroidota bacterium]|nr:T9SS type A sorting domain-containing protein [Bacteroidota bacterium]